MDRFASTPIHWPAARVEEEPEIEIGGWRVVECPVAGPGSETEPRLVGVTLTGRARLRISSRIVGWDASANRATTGSGRVYHLAALGEDLEGMGRLVDDYVAMLVAGGGADVTDAVKAADGGWQPTSQGPGEVG